MAPLLAIAVVLIAARLYGTYRLNQDPVENMPAVDSEQFASREANSGESASGGSRLKVALVQCAKDIVFEYNPERDIEVFDQCRRQSMIATEEHPDLQLLVWPESAFTEQVREVVLEGPVVPPPGLDLSAEEFDRRVRRMLEVFAEKVEHVVALVNRHAVRDEAMQPRTHLIVGCEAEYLGPRPRRYNSALHLTPEGTVEDRYYKMHRVAFGEYLPLGDQFPGIYAFTPMAGGLTAGAQPAVFSVHGWKITPTICFESTVPHLIRNQIRDLTEQGEAPDMLVNVTNDGWFRNTSLLDLHFACAVFRSIENRIPVLVAANSGISVWLDGSGRTRAKAPRRVPSYVYAEVTRDERNSLYQRIGDAPAGACLLATLIFAFRGLADARTRRKRKTAS